MIFEVVATKLWNRQLAWTSEEDCSKQLLKLDLSFYSFFLTFAQFFVWILFQICIY